MADQLSPEENEMFKELLRNMDIPDDRKAALESLPAETKRMMIQPRAPGHMQTKDPGEYLDKLKRVVDAGKDYKKARKRCRDAEFLTSLRGLSISLRTNGISWVLQFLSKQCQGLEVLVQYMHYRFKMESELLHSKPEEHRLNLEVDGTENDLHICVTCMRALANASDGFKAVTGHPHAITSLTQAMFFGTMRTITTTLELLAALCLVKGGHEKIMTGIDNFKVQQGETYRFQKLVGAFKENGLNNPEFATSCMTFINIVVNSCEDLNYRVYLQHEFTMLDIDDYLEELEAGGKDHPKLLEQIKAYQDNYFNVDILVQDAATKDDGFKRAMVAERQLKELQKAHKKAEYQSIKKIAELEKKLYDLKKFIKTLHETVPRSDKPEEDQLTSAEVPVWLSKDLAIKIRKLTLVPTERLPQMLVQAAKQGPAPVTAIPPQLLPAYVQMPPPASGPPEPHLDANPAATATHPIPPGEGSLSSTPPGQGPLSPTLADEGPLSPTPHGEGLLPPSLPGEIPLSPSPPEGDPTTPRAPPPPGMAYPPPAAGVPQLPGAFNAMSTLPSKQRYQPKHRLPQMNWAAIPAGKVEGTIFGELNEEDMMQRVKDQIDRFEEMFKTRVQQKKRTATVAPKKTMPRKHPPKEQVLETGRIRNVAISLHKIKKPLPQLKIVIQGVNVGQLNPEEVDILMKIAPTDEEMKKFKKFLGTKKQISSVSDEEQFMYELGGVERLTVKLRVMNFIHTLPEDMLLITAQIDALVAASSSLLGCQGLKRVFEMILTFGNYMNSGKRAAAYGFKIQSLDMLLETRSTDRKMSLMQYIVQLMTERFPEHAEFYDEVLYLNKAGLVSLDQLSTDVRVIAESFQMAVGELVKDRENNVQLRDFVIETEEKVRDLKDRFQMAEDTYHKVVGFYGEDPKTTEPGPFFNEFARFIAAYKKSERQNDLTKQQEEERLKQETEAKEKKAKKEEPPVVSPPEKLEVLTEAKEGTIDQLISDMKGKVFIAKVRKDRVLPGLERLGLGGVLISNPAAPIADFTANQSLEPVDDFSKLHPWLY